jgi:hypothetical protein
MTVKKLLIFTPHSTTCSNQQNHIVAFALTHSGESYKGAFHHLTDRSNVSLLSTSRLTRMVAAMLKLDDLNEIVSQQEF